MPPEITIINEEEGNAQPPNTASGPGEELSNVNLFRKYELGRLLGYGAFAKVYHARDLRSGQSVAIKSISKQRILKGNLLGHIKREISIMRRLRHPHIVRLHEVLATKTKIYFVMEFARGGELFAKIAKGRFSEDLSRKYFHQLISAVSYCHSRGVFHRDLKPENLLLDENWELKVTDFGLSALVTDDRPLLLHTLCGTPAYVAPEVLAKKGYDGATVDVWSCGVILYVLNAGYLPFNDQNLMTLYRKIYRGEFRCPKWMSPDLKRFLTRILDPNPKTRFTFHEILNDPWFRKGGSYKEAGEIMYSLPPVETEFYLKQESSEPAAAAAPTRFLNAFDLISYHPGADLSGLFSISNNETGINAEIFVSAESPEKIIKRIEVLAGEEDSRVRVVAKKGMGVRLQGQGRETNFVAVVEIHRLTEDLVVVEVRRRKNVSGPDLWTQKFNPRLIDLVHQPPV